MSFEWLKRPMTVMVSIVIGGCAGLFWKPAAGAIAPLGDLYLVFLKMLVIPIMATVVIASLAKLFASRSAAKYLKRMAAVFALGLVIAALIGISIGLVGQPGSSVDESARAVLGRMIMDHESGLAGSSQKTPEYSVWSVLRLLITDNIFRSLQQGENLQILFVSVIFGIALGKLSLDRRNEVIPIVEMTYRAFEKMMSWSLYGLPAGLLCIVAGEFARLGSEMFYAMASYIALIYAACFLLMAGGGFIIGRMRKNGWTAFFRDMKEPLFIAFGTRNSMVAIPSVIETLRAKYRMNEEMANLVVPLGIVVCRYSLVIVFSIGTIFVAELYGVSLGARELLLVFTGSILAAVAGAGAPIIVSLSMISLILDPLGLPSETAVVMLLSVLTMIDPVLTMLNVYLSGLSALLIGATDKRNPTQLDS